MLLRQPFSYVLSFLLLMCGLGAPTIAAPSVAYPKLAEFGQHSVGVRTLTVVNHNQLNSVDFTSRYDRPLTLEVWYPAVADERAETAIYSDVLRSGTPFTMNGVAVRDAAINIANKRTEKEVDRPYTLLVFSHGYTGYRSLFYRIAEHLASHGYVVASIDHTDSRNQDVDFSVNPGSGMPSTLLNRARDQQFTLEYMLEQSDFKDALHNKAGLLGYSMGGYGALSTIGGCYEFSDAFLAGFQFPADKIKTIKNALNTCTAGRDKPDSRWQAAATFAPWGGAFNVFSPSSLASITIPTLLVAGDKDDVSGFRDGVETLFGYLTQPESYLMVYENARHNFIGHATPPKAHQNELDAFHYFEPVWDSETLTHINQHILLAFYNCKLKQQADACAMLPKRENAEQQTTSNGEKQAPWPGFADRMSLGMRFYRNDQSQVSGSDSQ